MDAIRALIVDDEELARLRIRRLLETQPDVDVSDECSCAKDAVEAIQAEQPELVYLDVQMPDGDGFSVLEHLELETLPVVIFITAYDQYAIRAFENQALDYLLKPFSNERFEQALERARRRIRERHISSYSDRLLALLEHYQAAASEATSPAPEESMGHGGRLVLKTGGRLIFVDPEQVDWIEAEGVYVRIHTREKSYLLRESLSNVEARLSDEQFIRIHRSTIVNVHRIKEVVPHYNGGAIVTLTTGKQLKLSRSYRDQVNATLG